MNILDINTLKPSGQDVATFQGRNMELMCLSSSFASLPAKAPGSIVILDGETKTLCKNNIVIIPAGTWHEFKNRCEKPVFMVNIHPRPADEHGLGVIVGTSPGLQEYNPPIVLHRQRS